MTRMEEIQRALSAHLRLKPVSRDGDLIEPTGLDQAAYALSSQGVEPCELWDITISCAVYDNVRPGIRHVQQGLWELVGLVDAARAVRAIGEPGTAGRSSAA